MSRGDSEWFRELEECYADPLLGEEPGIRRAIKEFAELEYDSQRLSRKAPSLAPSVHIIQRIHWQWDESFSYEPGGYSSILAFTTRQKALDFLNANGGAYGYEITEVELES
jgi:hypothetical protein